MSFFRRFSKGKGISRKGASKKGAGVEEEEQIEEEEQEENDPNFIALQISAREGNVENVKTILELFPAYLHCRDVKKRTVLHCAVQRNHLGVAEVVLAAGIDPNLLALERKVSPLYLAAQNGFTEMVELLLHYGAEVDLRNINGVTPLLKAAQKGHIDIVVLLLKHNAAVDARDNLGYWPMSVAMNFPKIMEILLESGADVHLTNAKNQATLLYSASSAGLSEIALLLLRHGADVNSPNRNGASPLLKASQKGHEDIVRLLVHHGADLNWRDFKGFFPLYVAVQKGHRRIISFLLEKGADIHQVTHYGATCLYSASYEGRSDVVVTLLQHGGRADLDRTTKFSESPLFIAARRGHKDVMKILIEHGASVGLFNHKGKTALDCAIDHKDKLMTQMLLSAPLSQEVWGVWNEQSQNNTNNVIHKDKSEMKTEFSSLFGW
eukprot:CAMPEP_0201524682 /NCGR_PEP_ID=MMETSP0161_2-20130828/24317_1 /ASSEMBLY_ACC=CAM_ASM_000251 /TAXON_ID=180227 /ORGANISM="Neoparamoeba aestuarina, Strain SoJaBio B1-5/56/2" /LENGTH=436 /DNA_ID=CAMNT_0047924199 /DNA_START=262 /DNA_END=1569 /DNA_ORIENTATION=-